MVRFHSDLSPERLRARLTALSGPNPVPEGQIQVCLWRNDHFRLTFHMEPSKGKDALFEGKFRSDSRGGTQIYGRFGGSRQKYLKKKVYENGTVDLVWKKYSWSAWEPRRGVPLPAPSADGDWR